MGYSEKETGGPRTRPSFATKSYRFQVQIRKSQFVNSNANNRIFQNISGEWMLSEEMKRFSEIARTKRIEYIKMTLVKKCPMGLLHPIPITQEEADIQQSETSLTKPQILSIINSLIPSLEDSDRLRFRSLSNKTRNNLVNILQEIRGILAEKSIVSGEELEENN